MHSTSALEELRDGNFQKSQASLDYRMNPSQKEKREEKREGEREMKRSGKHALIKKNIDKHNNDIL